MLPEFRRALANPIIQSPARLLAKSGLNPNVLTILGFLLALVAALILATGHLFLGGFLVLVSGAADLLDGSVARMSGKTTRFGGLLDSVLDRFSEAALFSGLIAYYANQGSLYELVLVTAALVGSMMTSYVKARAEGLGMKCEVGIFTRPERVILLAIGLIFNQLLIILWIIAILSNLTAWHRLFYLWQQSKKQD